MKTLTYSSLATYRACPRKYHLAYEEGFRHVRPAEALRFGSLIHAALEAFWSWVGVNGGPSPLEAAMSAVTSGASDPLDQIKAAEVMAGYGARWSGEAAKSRVLGVETAFAMPLLHPETLEASAEWRVGGKIDLLLGCSDGAVVVDSKTTSLDIASDADPFWNRIATDPQLGIYTLGAESLGHEVAGRMYDVIRKPETRFRTATPADKRKYTKDGVLYANQRERDETQEDFRGRLHEEISTNLDKYYRRREVPRLSSDMQNLLSDLWDGAGEIGDAQRLNRWPRNPDSCQKYGSPCEYMSICWGGERIEESADFVRLADVHPELSNVREGAQEVIHG